METYKQDDLYRELEEHLPTQLWDLVKLVRGGMGEFFKLAGQITSGENVLRMGRVSLPEQNWSVMEYGGASGLPKGIYISRARKGRDHTSVAIQFVNSSDNLRVDAEYQFRSETFSFADWTEPQLATLRIFLNQFLSL